MALLLIKIEDTASLALNEFFDYNGRCYASTGFRGHGGKGTFPMEVFYEAALDTQMLEDIPVFFAVAEGEQVSVIGWYTRARIFRKSRSIALFLEGNIEASAADAVLLPEKAERLQVDWRYHDQLFDVIEEEDDRYVPLVALLTEKIEDNKFLRYPYVTITPDRQVVRNAETCLSFCREAAERIAEDQCQDIRELKMMEKVAGRACELNRKDPDGFYYHALACYHLGFFRDGIRSVEKAIRLEPEAADLQALKGMLLANRGHYREGAGSLQLAWERTGADEYLLQEGRVWQMAGQMDQAYDCFRQMKNRELLDQAGIVLQDMEKRWSLRGIRGFRRRSRRNKKK